MKCIQCFLNTFHVLIHLILSTTLLGGHHHPYFTGEKTGTQRFSDLTKVILLISGKAGIRTQPFFFFSSGQFCSKLPVFLTLQFCFILIHLYLSFLKRYLHYARNRKALHELILLFTQTCYFLSFNVDSPVLAT